MIPWPFISFVLPFILFFPLFLFGFIIFWICFFRFFLQYASVFWFFIYFSWFLYVWLIFIRCFDCFLFIWNLCRFPFEYFWHGFDIFVVVFFKILLRHAFDLLGICHFCQSVSNVVIKFLKSHVFLLKFFRAPKKNTFAAPFHFLPEIIGLHDRQDQRKVINLFQLLGSVIVLIF